MIRMKSRGQGRRFLHGEDEALKTTTEISELKFNQRLYNKFC